MYLGVFFIILERCLIIKTSRQSNPTHYSIPTLLNVSSDDDDDDDDESKYLYSNVIFLKTLFFLKLTLQLYAPFLTKGPIHMVTIYKCSCSVVSVKKKRASKVSWNVVLYCIPCYIADKEDRISLWKPNFLSFWYCH